MAKKKDVVLADSVKDPETGKLIHFSEEEKRDLLFCERQMKVGFMQIAIALKTIRDRRLYCCANAIRCARTSRNTFNSHTVTLIGLCILPTRSAMQRPTCSSPFPGYVVGDRPESGGRERSERGGCRRRRGAASDGEVLPLEEFTARIRREIQRNAEKKEDKLQRRIDTIAAEVKTKNEALAHYERLIADGNEREKRLEETIESLSVRKDLDAHILAYITQKGRRPPHSRLHSRGVGASWARRRHPEGPGGCRARGAGVVFPGGGRGGGHTHTGKLPAIFLDTRRDGASRRRRPEVSHAREANRQGTGR